MSLRIFVSTILFAVIAMPATAQYTPPVNSIQKQRVRSQNVRGCEGERASVELIAPTEEKIKTTNSNPTFLVELSDIPSTPLIVSITRSHLGDTVYYREFTPAHSGLISIQTAADLTQGEYVVTIGYFCQRNPNRSPVYLRVAFEKIDLTQQQQNLLSNNRDREKLLKSWGFNYDVLVLQNLAINR